MVIRSNLSARSLEAGCPAVWITLIAGLLCACSERNLYDALQKRNESHCNELPTAQQEECIREMKGPEYERYQRELKAE